MKYKEIIAVSILFLQGCAMMQINDDMMNNKFFDHQPVNVDIEGIYSAPIGPFISTYVINKDGTGINCYLNNGTAILHKLKLYGRSNGELSMITETGVKSKITRADEGNLVLDSYGNYFVLKPDNNLENSSIVCKEKLSTLI